ncbi:THUMP-like domain-containing protein [Maribacter hydrothermalis]|uniref:SAM-dependent methyltransferase n=1 Tax=Maribacter hydrothermalis TaxID=1836467 RepID=A0A1B7ZDD0_9FLAO|nr:RsmD family RNA methyltransferase [Maribacter hydrothermalis]APQ18478.1 SAM-dependent methyltransferase [Maribacter hydrothermalis]OBR41315.1 SAM-dependent methyltransferase [Maribacter hydrothermalis]
MNSFILTNEVQQFINDNLNSDIHKILLKKSPFSELSTKELVEQIESKIKAKQKIPTWFKTDNIIYPNKLNLSQTSSELTAEYKTSLVDGNSLIDLTGGFGVDSFAFSKKVTNVIHVEKNNELSALAKHNFNQLKITNIICIPNDGIPFLKKSKDLFDWIYIDPSRRDKNNKKVYYLSDCEPNIVEHIDLLFSKSNHILIKTGPLLDLNTGLKQLNNVKEIHIIAIGNDVKEVLWILKKNYTKEALIKTVNFKNDIEQKFEFKISQEKVTTSTYSLPKTYLYEPNASILKSGAFNLVGKHYNLEKLHPNSHLYTSNDLIEFPGRVFKILQEMDYSKKSFKKMGIIKANISTRNFPDSVATIRKKLKLKDGGKTYLMFTTNKNQNLITLYCHQVFI